MQRHGVLRKYLLAELMLPTILLVLGVMTAFGWVVVRVLDSEVRSRADSEAESQASSVLSNLDSIDQLSSAAVHSAMNILRKEAAGSGAPHLEGGARVGDQNVPNLRLGAVSQAGNFALVDRLKALTGATATLFVKRGDDFVRISTNVMKPDGSRAVGTVLDPKGRAFAAIQAGEPFYGVVNILGKPYMTGYEPMKNAAGQTVGIWYVGFPLAAVGDLARRIGGARILDHGFVALLQPDGPVVAKSEGVRDEEVHQRMERAQAEGWAVISRPFEKWRYQLVAAYPLADIAGRLRRLQLLVLACAATMLAFMLLSQYALLSALVLRPIRQLVHRMENADLNTTLLADRADEIGILAGAFDRFIANIRESLLKVIHTSSQVAAAASQISSATAESAKGADNQKDQLQQVATAMHEMSATVREVSASSNQAAKVSVKAAETAREGGGLVDGTLVLMQSISASVSDNAMKVQELGAQSDRIGEIADVIEEIADQTNLLALNAAIEAARAGEQGRGFAVVADEVRKLAERTSKATKEIESMIAGIQAGTRAAVARMEAGTLEVARGLAETSRAGVSLKNIIAQADSLGEMITQIATAAAQQSAATESVNQNVNQIHTIASESAESALQSARACEQLSALAIELENIVGRFRINPPDQYSPDPSQPAHSASRPAARKAQAALAGRA